MTLGGELSMMMMTDRDGGYEGRGLKSILRVLSTRNDWDTFIYHECLYQEGISSGVTLLSDLLGCMHCILFTAIHTEK